MDHDYGDVDSSGRETPSRTGGDSNSTITTAMLPEGHDVFGDNPHMSQSAPSATVANEKAAQSTPSAMSPDTRDGGVAAAAAVGVGGEEQAEAGVANLIFSPTCRPSSGDDRTESAATTGSCTPPAATAAASFSSAPTTSAEGDDSSSSTPLETPGIPPTNSAPSEHAISSGSPSSSSATHMSPQHVHVPSPTPVSLDPRATTAGIPAGQEEAETAAVGEADAGISCPTKVAEPPDSDGTLQQEAAAAPQQEEYGSGSVVKDSSGAAREASQHGATSKSRADTPYIFETKGAPGSSPSALGEEEEEEEDSRPDPSLVPPVTTDPDPDPGAPAGGTAAAALKQEKQQKDSDASDNSSGKASTKAKGAGTQSATGAPPAAARISSLSPSSPPYNMSSKNQTRPSGGQRQPSPLPQGSPGHGPHEWARQTNNFIPGSPHHGHFQGHVQQQQQQQPPPQVFGNHNHGYQQPMQAFYGRPPMQHGSGSPMLLGGGGGSGGGGGELSFQPYSGFSLPVAGRAPLLPAFAPPGQGGRSFDSMVYHQEQHMLQHQQHQQDLQSLQSLAPQQPLQVPQHQHLQHQHQHVHGSMGATPTPIPASANASLAPPNSTPTSARPSPSTSTTATSSSGAVAAAPSSAAVGAPSTPASQGTGVAAGAKGVSGSGSGASSGVARGGAARGTVAGVMAAAAAAAGGADGEAVQNAYNDIGLVVTRTKELEKIMRDLFHATGKKERRGRVFIQPARPNRGFCGCCCSAQSGSIFDWIVGRFSCCTCSVSCPGVSEQMRAAGSMYVLSSPLLSATTT